MPYFRIEPDLFLEHDDIEVYPLYEGDEPQKYWFTTDPGNADHFYGHGRNGHFDVRRLPGKWETTPFVSQWDAFWKERFANEDHAIRTLIIEAIERKSPAVAKQDTPS